MDRTCEGALLVDFHGVPQFPLFEDVDDEVASSASQA